VGVDRVEHPEGDGTDRLLRVRTAGHPGHDTGDDVVGGRREEFVLTGDVPVDRPGSGGQAGRERTEGQGVLTVGVEDLGR
jgi:hypothetical protein